MYVCELCSFLLIFAPPGDGLVRSKHFKVIITYDRGQIYQVSVFYMTLMSQELTFVCLSVSDARNEPVFGLLMNSLFQFQYKKLRNRFKDHCMEIYLL
jgi:hypothetical protein